MHSCLVKASCGEPLDSDYGFTLLNEMPQSTSMHSITLSVKEIRISYVWRR